MGTKGISLILRWGLLCKEQRNACKQQSSQGNSWGRKRKYKNCWRWSFAGIATEEIGYMEEILKWAMWHKKNWYRNTRNLNYSLSLISSADEIFWFWAPKSVTEELIQERGAYGELKRRKTPQNPVIHGAGSPERSGLSPEIVLVGQIKAS